MHDVCRWRDCRNQTFGEDEIIIISEPASDSEIFIQFRPRCFTTHNPRRTHRKGRRRSSQPRGNTGVSVCNLFAIYKKYARYAGRYFMDSSRA